MTFPDANDPTVHPDVASVNLDMSGTVSALINPGYFVQASVVFTFTGPSGGTYHLIINDNGSGPVVTNDFNVFGLPFDPRDGRAAAKWCPQFFINTNTPQTFSMNVDVYTFVGGYQANGHAIASFADTFSLATTGPVFNLPPGITAYGDGIIDNHYFNPFAPQVPLPGTLPSWVPVSWAWWLSGCD